MTMELRTLEAILTREAMIIVGEELTHISCMMVASERPSVQSDVSLLSKGEKDKKKNDEVWNEIAQFAIGLLQVSGQRGGDACGEMW